MYLGSGDVLKPGRLGREAADLVARRNAYEKTRYMDFNRHRRSSGSALVSPFLGPRADRDRCRRRYGGVAASQQLVQAYYGRIGGRAGLGGCRSTQAKTVEHIDRRRWPHLAD